MTNKASEQNATEKRFDCWTSLLKSDLIDFVPFQFLVCLGCCGQIRKSLELAMETPSLVKRPNNPLEKFLVRRAQRMVQENIDQQFCLLLGYVSF